MRNLKRFFSYVIEDDRRWLAFLIVVCTVFGFVLGALQQCLIDPLMLQLRAR